MAKYAGLMWMCFCSCFFSAQETRHGLEGIIVEKYYKTTKEDLLVNNIGGNLKKNSTTYRIFVDLLPGYRFQAAYGSGEHPLYIKTTTDFYNNIDKGSTVASLIPRRSLGKNTVMLDSWISVGTAGELSLGILKEEDDSTETIPHESNLLSGTDIETGSSLKVKDGLTYSIEMPSHTLFGLDSVIQVFGNKGGNEFVVNNGAWACMGKGSLGPDSLTNNRILIGQVTTDGELSFELNIQIGTPEGKVQRYVARNPMESEFTHESLVLSSKKSKKTKK
jgi:hypothetical protein